MHTGPGCRVAGVCCIRVSVCVRVWAGAERRARPLLCRRLHAVVSTALFTSATSTAYIASITTTTVISPSNDNVLEQFGGVEANSLCRLFNTNLIMIILLMNLTLCNSHPTMMMIV